MDNVTTIGLDIAKSVFQVHGVDAVGAVVIRRQLTRGRVLGFFEKLPRCLVGIEACSSSHYWARELIARGHDVRLLPAQYVKFCRDALPACGGDACRWEELASTLQSVGARATELATESDLALCVLAEFADETTCREIVDRARQLVAGLPERALRQITADAATVVDLKFPDQSFRFRATLVLISMIAGGVSTSSGLPGLVKG